MVIVTGIYGLYHWLPRGFPCYHVPVIDRIDWSLGKFVLLTNLNTSILLLELMLVFISTRTRSVPTFSRSTIQVKLHWYTYIASVHNVSVLNRHPKYFPYLFKRLQYSFVTHLTFSITHVWQLFGGFGQTLFDDCCKPRVLFCFQVQWHGINQTKFYEIVFTKNGFTV